MLLLRDIQAGRRFESARRTVTEGEMMGFAGVTGDFNPVHVDEVFAREESLFGRRIVHGPMVLAMCFGMRSERDEWKILALLETRRRFLAPVFPGDTVHACHEVTQVRPSGSRPGIGIVTVAVEVRNERDEVVQDGVDVLVVADR